MLFQRVIMYLILLSPGKKHFSSSSSSSSSSKTIGKNSESSSVAKIENSEGSEENSFQLTKLPQAEKEQEKKTLDQKTLIKTLVEQRNQKRVCEPSKGNQKIRNYTDSNESFNHVYFQTFHSSVLIPKA